MSTRKGWPEKRIGDLFEIQLGKMLSPKARTGNALSPYLRNVDVQWGRINVSNLPTMNFDQREAAKFALLPGDVLVCEGGEPGRSAVWLGEAAQCYYQKAIHRLRPRNDEVLPDFYVAWARAAFRKYGKHDFSEAKTTIAHLPAVRLAELLMPVPPISTQRSVACVLGTIQRSIDIQSRRVQFYKELKAATIARIFREGIRREPLKRTEIGDLPKSWAVRSLADVCSFFSGGTPPKDRALHWAGPVPWLSPKDMKRPFLSDTIDHISDSAATSFSRIMPANTIFVVVRGMVLAKDFPIVLSSVPMAFNQDVKAIVPSGGILPAFLFYALMSRKDAIQQEVGSSAHGTKRIGTASLENLFIPVPPSLEEQNSIADMLMGIDRVEDVATAYQALLSELFGSALERLMAGELDTEALELQEFPV